MDSVNSLTSIYQFKVKREAIKMNYSALEMLYATHIIEGKRTIESVPLSIREDVAEIVTNAKKQEEAN